MTILLQICRRSSRLLFFLFSVLAWQTSWADATWTWTANNAASATDATDAMKKVTVTNYGDVSFAFADGSKSDVFTTANNLKFSGSAVKITITLPEGKTFNAGDRFTIKTKGGKSGKPGWLIVGEDGKTDLIPDKTTDETKSQAEYTSTVKLSSSFTSSNTIVLRPAASSDKYTDGTTTGGGSFYLSNIEYTQASSVVDPFSKDPATTTAFGYGAGATGGAGGTIKYITTQEELAALTKSTTPTIAIIKNDITVTKQVEWQGVQNLTLLGLSGVKLISTDQTKAGSGILKISGNNSTTDSENIIIRNITFVGPGAYDVDGNDLLSIDGMKNAWIDHCDFQDGVDDCLDFKASSNVYDTDNITVSWCRFHYLKDPKSGGSGGTDDHRFANLVGNDSDSKPADGIYNLTWAYNWWDEGCVERQVRSRNADMHYINDVWSSSVAHYFAGPENTSSVFSGCYFGTTNNHITSNYIWHPYNQSAETDNPVKFEDCTSTDATYGSTYMANIGTPTAPTYTYGYDTAADAYTLVTNETTGAGATLNVDEQGNISIGGGTTSIDYSLDFTSRGNWASTTTIPSKTTYYVTAFAANGTPTLTTTKPDTYLASFYGQYHGTTYGLYPGAKVEVPVAAGTYRVTLGCNSDYSGNIDITGGKSTVTISNVGTAKYYNDATQIKSDYVTFETAGTMTIGPTGANIYLPYVRIESTDAPAATYTITYHNNNHGTAPDNVTSATALPNPLPTMSEEGYTFNGWFTDEALQTAAVAGATITANADLYAKWTQNSPAAYPLTATWDFTSAYTSGQYSVQTSTNPNTLNVPCGTFSSGNPQNLYVDASASGSKFSTRGTDVQVNKGTKIRVPITSNSDVVTVTATSGGASNFTICGIEMSADETSHTATNGEATQGYVVIEATGSSYLKKIVVVQHNETIEKGTKTVTYYDYDGITSLGTQTVTEGDGVGTYSYTTCTLPTGYTFGGWYTAGGTAFTTEYSVAEDMSVYPYIYKVENGYNVIPKDCGILLSLTLRKATSGSKIFVPNGTYDFGTIVQTPVAAGVSLIGESMEGTIIKNEPNFETIGSTATIKFTGEGGYIQDVTLQCTSTYGTSSDATAERGAALWDKGTKNICKNVYLKGTQDTYVSAGSNGMYGYFDGGKIEGTVDFICGSGTIYFNGVSLYCANSARASKTTQDYIAAPATYAEEKGYVFNGCTVTGEASQAGTYYFARAWKESAAAAFVNTVTTDFAPATTIWGANMNSFTGTRRFAVYPTPTGFSNDGTALTEANTAIDKVFTDWTPNTIAEQVTTLPESGDHIYLWANGTISTSKPTYATVRVANSRGGFGPELTQSSNIETSKTSDDEASKDKTTATGEWTSDGIIKAVEETTTTQTTQIDLSSATLTNATSENKVTIPTANPNVIIKAKDAAQAATIANDNVVYNNGTENVCNSFVVKDGGNMKITEGFKATSAKYTRTVASGETLNGKLGTIYLPFPVKSDNNVKYYTFESLSSDGNTMNLTYVETLEANTPAVVKYVSDGTSISAANASVAVVGGSSSTDKAYKLVGTYEPITLTVTQDDARYYFAGTTGKFYSFTQAPNGVVNVPAFRAYFAPKDANAAKAMNLNLNLIEGDATGINDVNASTGSAQAQSTCYNLAGQKVNADTKGFVIKNGRKYFNK